VPAEQPIAAASHEIIHKVAQTARKCTQYFREDFPNATEAPQDVKRSVGSQQQGAVSSKHDERVRQFGTPVGRHAGSDGFPLQRRKSEGVSRTVVFQHEFYAAVAQAAVAVVEDIFDVLREWWHCEKSIARRESGSGIFEAGACRGTHISSRRRILCRSAQAVH